MVSKFSEAMGPLLLALYFFLEGDQWTMPLLHTSIITGALICGPGWGLTLFLVRNPEEEEETKELTSAPVTLPLREEARAGKEEGSSTSWHVDLQDLQEGGKGMKTITDARERAFFEGEQRLLDDGTQGGDEKPEKKKETEAKRKHRRHEDEEQKEECLRILERCEALIGREDRKDEGEEREEREALRRDRHYGSEVNAESRRDGAPDEADSRVPTLRKVFPSQKQVPLILTRNERKQEAGQYESRCRGPAVPSDPLLPTPASSPSRAGAVQPEGACATRARAPRAFSLASHKQHQDDKSKDGLCFHTPRSESSQEEQK